MIHLVLKSVIGNLFNIRPLFFLQDTIYWWYLFIYYNYDVSVCNQFIKTHSVGLPLASVKSLRALVALVHARQRILHQ